MCGVVVGGEVAGEVVVWRVFDEVVKRWGGMLLFRICICQRSVKCVDLDYFRRSWVFGVYSLLGCEVCKLFFMVAFGGSVLDGR